MKSKKLPYYIEIQKYSEVENEVGEITKKWTTYKKLWADKKRLRSSNTSEGNKEGIEYTYRFKVRYRTDLNESMRIIYKGIIYDIEHINNIEDAYNYETYIDCVHHREGAYNE